MHIANSQKPPQIRLGSDDELAELDDEDDVGERNWKDVGENCDVADVDEAVRGCLFGVCDGDRCCVLCSWSMTAICVFMKSSLLSRLQNLLAASFSWSG